MVLKLICKSLDVILLYLYISYMLMRWWMRSANTLLEKKKKKMIWLMYVHACKITWCTKKYLWYSTWQAIIYTLYIRVNSTKHKKNSNTPKKNGILEPGEGINTKSSNTKLLRICTAKQLSFINQTSITLKTYNSIEWNETENA